MINFNLTFQTNRDGFTPSQAQQDAMNLAASNWGSIFGNIAELDLLVESSFDSNGDGLMSAGSSFAELPNPGFGNVAVPRNKILTGNDLNGAVGTGGSDNGFDGVIEVNWAVNWELDINETPNLAENEFDFYSTFYHEMAHILGFDTSIARLNDADPNIYVDIFNRGDETPGSWTQFDTFLTDSRGASVIDSSTNQIDSDTFNNLVTGGSSADGTSGLFFSGPNAIAANNGSPVGLFSPAAYDSSSSVVHLDDDNPAFEGALTLATVDAGPAARSLNAVEQAIFADLGYTVLRGDIAPAPTSNDGQSNLLWHNSITGEAVSWSMNGDTYVGSASLGTASTDWDLVGSSDFNDDDNSDLLWHNSSTGEAVSWYMDGSNYIGGASLGTASTDWQLVGGFDFNNDGNSELLWHNSMTGKAVAWYVSGGTYVASQELGSVSTDWQLVGASDFNNDGNSDLLWHNRITGAAVTWFMEGGTYLASKDLGVAPTEWQLIGASNLNNDVYSDLLWQNSNTGEAVTWYMNAGTYAGSASLGAAAADWQLVG